MASNPKDKEELKRFALAANTIALCASQAVITALMDFQKASSSNEKEDIVRQSQLLNELVLAIRRDIKLSAKDDANTFKFRLLTSSIQKD